MAGFRAAEGSIGIRAWYLEIVKPKISVVQGLTTGVRASIGLRQVCRGLWPRTDLRVRGVQGWRV